MERLSTESDSLFKTNIEKVGRLFPNVITEAKDENGKLIKSIDFELLKQELSGQIVSEDCDRYQLTWPGKKEAILLTNTPTSKALKAVKEESANWDSTGNLYIEGDNLDVLKILQKSYIDKVKCIYIDPPYNTGKAFIYKDDFSMGANRYLEKTGQNSSSDNEFDGRFHSNWLTMMYSRLKLARNLLQDDGVIFVSIDNNELYNLQIMMNEIFGESNYVETFIWTKTSTPPSLSIKSRKTAEYVLCYEKKLSGMKYYGTKLENCDAPLLNAGNPVRVLSFPRGTIRFTFLKDGCFSAGRYNRVELLNDFEVKDGINVEEVFLKGEFKWTKDFMLKEIQKGTYFIVKSSKFSIRFQRPNNEENFKPPTNLLDVELNKNSGVGTNENAVKELEFLGMGRCFDYPKPLSLIKKILNMVIKDDKEAIVLDFFSGSATTAHAVMELNASDEGRRKYIMVQKPKTIPKDSKAYEAGYSDICQIGKERILRAAKKIKEDTGTNIDYGFKVFKLD
ncbi:MAG: site-specific DNA-methyltransferase [Clostridiaceae bacterium]|jgi:adenine-specific DNA-methyltransferase|nr:site-specific DNA-methyltransferase [Clostridiaceae bacterium]